MRLHTDTKKIMGFFFQWGGSLLPLNECFRNIFSKLGNPVIFSSYIFEIWKKMSQIQSTREQLCMILSIFIDNSVSVPFMSTLSPLLKNSNNLSIIFNSVPNYMECIKCTKPQRSHVLHIFICLLLKLNTVILLKPDCSGGIRVTSARLMVALFDCMAPLCLFCYA